VSEPSSDLGARLRQFRHRRGLTQEELAGHAGMSADMVSRIEQGTRFPRLPGLLGLARALGVSLEELTGEKAAPDQMEAGIAALRDALVSPAALAGAGEEEDGPAVPLAVLRGRLAAARRAYWDGRFGLLAQMLPGTLHNARATARRDEKAFTALALARDLAAFLLVHYGQTDLAAIASERAVLAAWYEEDPLLAAAMRGTFAWVLLHQGRLAEAEDLAARTAESITPDSREQAAVRGVLLLTAVAPAAAAGRDASPYAAEARELAVLAGGAVPVFNTTFGLSQVAMQAVHSHAVAGNPAAAFSAARQVRPGELEAISYGRHLLDVAQAHADGGDDGGAIAVLEQAREISLAWWRQQGVARQLTGELSARAKRAPALLRDLAASAQGSRPAPYYRPGNGA
jgi:transcriptional regulator with XRE-family HTH domain